jgi:hypothetical protein
MLRTAQSLPLRAFDTGVRPDPFPDQAAGLLPGLLTATRTRLAPARDDELTTKDHLHKVISDLLVSRKIEASSPGCRSDSHCISYSRALCRRRPGRSFSRDLLKWWRLIVLDYNSISEARPSATVIAGF